MDRGVQIYLEPGTRIPAWIRNQTINVSVIRKLVKERKVRVLTISGGQALFFPGGGVEVKMPGSGEFWGAFQPLKVLETRSLKGRIIKERNRHLCQNCFCLTGEAESHQPSSVVGRSDIDFKCKKCGHQWRLKKV